MIDPEFEKRVILWAATCRDHRKTQRCATEVFCESLAYLYGEAEPMIGEDGKPIEPAPKERARERVVIDPKEVALFDEAYRDSRLTTLMRQMIRCRYIYGMSPKKVEDRCHLAHKTFQMHIEFALNVFRAVVMENAERLAK